MKLQNILIMLAAVLLCNIAQAQQKFKYTYDDSGNRTKRELVSTMLLMAATDSTEVEHAADFFYTADLQLDGNDSHRQDAFKVQIYPNPSNGIYTIELPELQPNESGTLQVYSVMGQVVQEYRSLHNVQAINIASATPGYYLVRIVIGKKVVAKTLIKQ